MKMAPKRLHHLRRRRALLFHFRTHGIHQLELPQTCLYDQENRCLRCRDLLHGVQEVSGISSQDGINSVVDGYGAGVADDLRDVMFLDDFKIEAVERKLPDLVARRYAVAPYQFEQRLARSGRNAKIGACEFDVYQAIQRARVVRVARDGRDAAGGFACFA